KLIPGLSLEIELLIINAAECEPYISCDESLIRNHVEELITGIDILAHALQADACVIAIEENKIEAIEILQQALSVHPASGIELKIISSLYPAGGERQLIKSITGMAVPADGLPVDIGVVCYNVGTAYAVQQAVMNNRPLVSRVVTVTGPGIQTPCNKHVRLGTSMADLVKQCGGYTDDFEYLIMGGPMMGIRLENDAVPVIKTTNCLLAAGKPLVAAQQAEQPCIRCDECANVCPANLQPQQLHWHSKVFNAERLQDYRLFDCIECGCCSYVCPSHIPLVERYRLAKSTIWEERRKQMDASHSRRRFEEKQVRDQRRALARKSRRQAGQTDTVASVSDRDRKQQEIAAAVNRVRKKREEKG
ncbi:MAG: electron transport complex subunit RsxC, partial [Gammaproteobacteria bacterium]